MPFFKYKDKDIYYEVRGEGKPILVLNGLMMSTLSWEPFMNTLTERNQVILYDMLDQGKSSRMVGEEYTHDIQVDLTYELINFLGYEKVNLCGLSYGAEVALEFSARHPEKVDRLVVLNGTASTTPWIKAMGDSWNKTAKDGDGEHYFRVSYPGIFSPHFYNDNLEFMEKREKVLIPVFDNKEFRERMIRLTNSSVSYNVRDILGNITAPTLIVAGEEDFLLPLYESKYLNHNIKDSQLVILYETGHTTVYERPHLIMSLTLGFINTKDVHYNI